MGLPGCLFVCHLILLLMCFLFNYPKYATCKTLFYQGKIAIVEVHKEIQMSIYPGKGGLTCLLSNLVKKVGVRGCISW